MNILGLIFTILLICACTFSLSLQKILLGKPVEIFCQNHLKATRKILNSYESECYKSLRSKSKKKDSKPKEQNRSAAQTKKKENPLPLNGECSRLNLWPLILEGKNKHPFLYETAAQILRSLYQKPLFGIEGRLEYALLDAMLLACQCEENQNSPPALEKLLLKDKNVKRLYPLQTIYYRMLKGTKLKTGKGYPCLSDFISIERNPSPLCLKHASPAMLSALFNPKAGVLLYEELHKNKNPLSKERILEICSLSGLTSISDDFFELLDLKTARHSLSGKKILVGEEGDVRLRKQVFLPKT